MNQPNSVAVPLKQPRAFSDFLKDIDRGKLHDHLSMLTAELTKDVLALKKVGSVTLKITLRPSKIEHNAMEVVPVVTFKQPQQEPKPSIFFSNQDGALTRDDPNQGKLAIETVDMETGEISRKPAGA